MRMQREVNSWFGKCKGLGKFRKISSEMSFFGGVFLCLVCCSAALPCLADFFSLHSSFIQREELVQKLKEKAFAFVETDPSEYREDRLAYILDVIDTPRFQENPRQFILDWIDQRGLTKEYRFVEDAALSFFRLEFDIDAWPNELDCSL